MKTLEQKTEAIFKLNNDLNKFIENEPQINQAFQKFIKNNGSEKNVYDFIFSETIINEKKLIDLYLEKKPDLAKEEKKSLNGLKNSINAVFEIKNTNKEGFELYNLVNEKTYKVKSLIKMVNYRGLFAGNYLICWLIPFNEEFYLFAINNVLKSSDKISAYRMAVSRQMEDFSLLYQDNPKKLTEIQANVDFLAKKFEKFFENREIITTSNKINSLLDAFNDYVDDEDARVNFEEVIELPEEYEFFDLNKEKNTQKVYDVGVMFDSESGLLTIPFFETFSKIFEIDDYKSIKGYKNCVNSFLQSEKTPPFVLKRVYDRFGDIFMQRIAEIINIKEEISFEDLLHRYKQEFLGKKFFSSPTILYSSKAFEEIMRLSADNEEKIPERGSKIGRNDLCLCGSGKKYKKCCM